MQLISIQLIIKKIKNATYINTTYNKKIKNTTYIKTTYKKIKMQLII